TRSASTCRQGRTDRHHADDAPDLTPHRNVVADVAAFVHIDARRATRRSPQGPEGRPPRTPPPEKSPTRKGGRDGAPRASRPKIAVVTSRDSSTRHPPSSPATEGLSDDRWPVIPTVPHSAGAHAARSGTVATDVLWGP